MTGRREQRADRAIKGPVDHAPCRQVHRCTPAAGALNEPIRIILDLPPISDTSGRVDERTHSPVRVPI